MCRNHWELDSYIRHHIAHLADEHRACSPIDQHDDGPVSLLSQLRHRLGIGLILVGHALAGNDAAGGFPTPPMSPTTPV